MALPVILVISLSNGFKAIVTSPIPSLGGTKSMSLVAFCLEIAGLMFVWAEATAVYARFYGERRYLHEEVLAR